MAALVTQRCLCLFGLVGLLSLAVAAAVVELGGVEFRASGLLLGWALALVSGLASHLLNAYALRTTPERFFGTVFTGMATRTAILLLASAAFYVAAPALLIPFLSALLVGYFAFLGLEVLELHRHAGGVDGTS